MRKLLLVSGIFLAAPFVHAQIEGAVEGARSLAKAASKQAVPAAERSAAAVGRAGSRAGIGAARSSSQVLQRAASSVSNGNSGSSAISHSIRNGGSHSEWRNPAARNTLSRSQVQRAATQLRSQGTGITNLTNRSLEQAPSYDEVFTLINKGGNLTEMSPVQFEQAQRDYQAALKKWDEIAHIRTEIFYLGSSEMEMPSPEQIRRNLQEINEALTLTQQAMISLGDNAVLKKRAAFLRNAKKFYTSLSSGEYPSFSEEVTVVERPDGRKYDDEEFMLLLNGDEPYNSSMFWWNLGSFFSKEAKGYLPRKMRVALLQDDEVVIGGLKKMIKRARLKDWTLDIFDDPEELLKRNASNYDLILTDILVKNGGGRYLSRQLRNRGYEGSILMISGFSGDRKFFNDGIDGMIQITNKNPEYFSNVLWSHLNRYYELVQKNGWAH